MKKRQFKRDDVKAAQGGCDNFRIGNAYLRDLPVNELAFWALSAQSDQHRIACVAMLLRKTNHGPLVREVLNSLEVRKEDK